MTPVSFVKTMESHAASLVTINRKTLNDSGIIRHDYWIIWVVNLPERTETGRRTTVCGSCIAALAIVVVVLISVFFFITGEPYEISLVTINRETAGILYQNHGIIQDLQMNHTTFADLVTIFKLGPKRTGLITASDQSAPAMHSCIEFLSSPLAMSET